jgi:Outer membrane protein beta-barrel domain
LDQPVVRAFLKHLSVDWEKQALLTRIVAVSCFFCCALPVLLGQATSTASRRFDLQAGGGFVLDNSDYDPNKLKGFAFYSTLDVTHHFGGEIVFHQANSGTGDKVYERTYEIGPRYYRHYGRFAPYIKGMYGRGVFNFPNSVANLAYNLFAGGGGVDVRILPYLNVRADYEYQTWRSFPPSGLTPQVITIGVAYHFPGDLRRGRHF